MWPRRNKGISKLKTDCDCCCCTGGGGGGGRTLIARHTRASGQARDREGGRKEGRGNHEKLVFVWIPREGKGAGGKYIDDISAKHVAVRKEEEEVESVPPTNYEKA